MTDAGAITRKLDFMRADIEEPGTSPAARLIAGHATLLLGAVEAVLKAHRPSTSDGRCCWCREADGQRSPWPCGEYRTIAAALAGERTSHG
jgi:hypothetical protein